MKKEIMALIDSAEGSYRINNIAELIRWTKDGTGRQVDVLIIHFDPINNVNFGESTVQINQRTYEGIIADIEQAIRKHMNTVANELMSNLNAGYRNI